MNPNGTPFIPLFFYVIYELEDGIYGYLLDWKPAWEAEKDYVAVYHFNGREAHYWIATNDASLLRTDALAFAIRVHSKKCRIVHTDLLEITPGRKR